MSARKQIFAEMNIPAPGEDTDILDADFSLPEPTKGTSKLSVLVQLETEGIVNLIARRKTGDTKATGTITVVAGADLVDGDNFTLDDGANPAMEFEFDDDAAITGDVAIALVAHDTADQVAHRVVDAINAATPLDITAALTDTPGEILLTHDTGGEDGNATILEDVDDAGFLVDGMAGGLDDGETVLPLNQDVAIAEGTPHREEIEITSDHQYNIQLDTDGDVEYLILSLNKDL